MKVEFFSALLVHCSTVIMYFLLTPNIHNIEVQCCQPRNSNKKCLPIKLKKIEISRGQFFFELECWGLPVIIQTFKYYLRLICACKVVVVNMKERDCGFVPQVQNEQNVRSLDDGGLCLLQKF